MSFNQQPRFLEQATTIVLENIGDSSFGTNELSIALCLSSSQVYRKIKQTSTFSTSQFIQKIRLEKAHEILELSDLFVSDIAYRIGFTSLAYFSRCFTKQFGYPPSDLRKGKKFISGYEV